MTSLKVKWVKSLKKWQSKLSAQERAVEEVSGMQGRYLKRGSFGQKKILPVTNSVFSMRRQRLERLALVLWSFGDY
jgi:hypothetical protein